MDEDVAGFDGAKDLLRAWGNGLRPDPDLTVSQWADLVDGHEVEFGSFSLRELQAVRGHLGLPVERDRHFTPVPLLELYEHLQRGRFEALY